MRRALALLVPLLLAGCMEDAPVQEPAATPEDACEARGLTDLSCGTFCELHAATCGLPEPAPMPYPTLPVPLPPGTGAALPTLNGSVPPIPPLCALVPAPDACPQL